MVIRGAVHEPQQVARYLRAIGLAEHPPPIATARYEQPEIDYSFDETAPLSFDHQ